jgi:hypothetical protein
LNKSFTIDTPVNRVIDNKSDCRSGFKIIS